MPVVWRAGGRKAGGEEGKSEAVCTPGVIRQAELRHRLASGYANYLEVIIYDKGFVN